MALIKQSAAAVLAVPPAFKDRCVVRCTDHKFGPNSNDAPMITCNWELCGIPNTTGGVETKIERAGKLYQLGGLRINTVYFTLTQKAIDSFFAEFWKKANGSTEFLGIDTENPDLDFLDSLCMEAVVNGKTQEERKLLTDEEKEELKAEGKQPIGEAITDGDGNPITRTVLNIGMWLKKWTGEVPEPF